MVLFVFVYGVKSNKIVSMTWFFQNYYLGLGVNQTALLRFQGSFLLATLECGKDREKTKKSIFWSPK
jgi:hypothetical protein